MHTQRRHALRAGVLAAGLALGLNALAQTAPYPDRAVKLMHGFAAGGNADAVARILAVELGKGLGQPVVVEPKPGAGGTIASGAVAAAKADGLTLLLATGGHAIAGALYDKLPYDTVKSFQPVSAVTAFPFLVITPAHGKHSSLQELLKTARARPGEITYGSAGQGTGQHLMGALMAHQAGVNMTHVAYRGESAAMTAVLSGEVDFVVVAPTTAVQHIKSGKLKALAASGASRWPGLPDVPTVAEQGVPRFEVRSWTAVLAPAGTPKPIVDRLQALIRQVLADEAVRTRLEEATGGSVQASTPAELETTLNNDLRRWTQLVKDAQIRKE